jgi:hypothetical protein
MVIKMGKILGYGEDSFTLWALKQHTSRILEEFDDKTTPSECLIFYRPSFGRRSRKNSSVFGEFDAIIVSLKNIYLIESKWDNLSEFNKDELVLRGEQTLRHQILSWYLTHWNKEYYGHWERFVEKHRDNFRFEEKTMPQKDSLLAINLEFILTKSLEHCKTISFDNIKNVLLFFYSTKKKSKPPTKTNRTFKRIPIDYSEIVEGNFVTLF